MRKAMARRKKQIIGYCTLKASHLAFFSHLTYRLRYRYCHMTSHIHRRIFIRWLKTKQKSNNDMLMPISFGRARWQTFQNVPQTMKRADFSIYLFFFLNIFFYFSQFAENVSKTQNIHHFVVENAFVNPVCCIYWIRN